jgi:hypothetical protein
MKLAHAVTALSLLFLPGPPAAPREADAKRAEKAKKPALSVRPAPRFGFSPMSVFFTADLQGGDESEEWYCPEIEWEWDDGGKSVKEADCPPWEQGATVERRFTSEHVFRSAGRYNVRVRLLRNGKAFLAQNVEVTVRPGLGDRSLDQ